MFNTILVAMGGSDYAEKALIAACEIAGILLGSVSRRFCQLAKCPSLVVR